MVNSIIIPTLHCIRQYKLTANAKPADAGIQEICYIFRFHTANSTHWNKTKRSADSLDIPKPKLSSRKQLDNIRAGSPCYFNFRRRQRTRHCFA